MKYVGSYSDHNFQNEKNKTNISSQDIFFFSSNIKMLTYLNLV